MSTLGVNTREGLNKYLSFRTVVSSLLGGTKLIRYISKNDIKIPLEERYSYCLEQDYWRGCYHTKRKQFKELGIRYKNTCISNSLTVIVKHLTLMWMGLQQLIFVFNM